MTVIRLARRETLQFALAGFAGVALSAFIADRTGRAEDFFLPGLLLNAAYAARLPGLDPGPLAAARGSSSPRSSARARPGARIPERLRLYTRASWIWVGVFTPAACGPAAALPRGSAARARDREDGHGAADLPGRDLAVLPGPQPGRGRRQACLGVSLFLIGLVRPRPPATRRRAPGAARARLGAGVLLGAGDAVVPGRPARARARQPGPDPVPARPRPDRALEGVPAAQAQDAGVHRPGGRPLPDPAHAHARDLLHRPDGGAGAAG